MYESPINVIIGELQTQYDNEIIKAVQKYDIAIDKDELIKALKNDRNQYEKGYKEGKEETFRKCVEALANWSFDTFPVTDYFFWRNFWGELLEKKILNMQA